MFMRETLACAIVVGLLASTANAADAPRFGQPITEADLAPWNISIAPDGVGLPPGIKTGRSASGNELHPVDQCDEDHIGAYKRESVELLRQHVDLERRRASLRERRDETGHTAPEDTACGARLPRLLRNATKPDIHYEGKPDHSNDEPHECVGDVGGQSPGDTHAENGANQQNLEVPRAPVVSINVDRNRACTINIGRSIAAACKGGITSASSGAATMPSPAKPPLPRPRKVTAGIASR